MLWKPKRLFVGDVLDRYEVFEFGMVVVRSQLTVHQRRTPAMISKSIRVVLEAADDCRNALLLG